ncbi:MAG TPA: glycosyltransferase family 4 protein [Candidatus Limnocylindrales bacterium]
MARFHVLVVARWYPSWDDPGRGSFVADHVAALVAGGHRVTVASFDPTGVRGPEATRPERAQDAMAVLAPSLAADVSLGRPASWGAGVAVARLPVILDGSRRRPRDVADAHWATLRPFGIALAARDPVDIVHAHTGLPDGIVAMRLADELMVPLLTTEHSSTAGDELLDREAASLYRRLLEPGRRLVAVSRSLADELAERLDAQREAIDVLPNAVPVADFPPGQGADRDADELLFVGARKASKGIELLLRAFARLHEAQPGCHLRLVGPPGPPEDEARWGAVISTLGIGDAVVIEGRADRAAVAAAMRRAGIFVHPSPLETFGMVAVEALASGLPVAATPSGGVEGIVTDASLGEIAIGHTPEALAAAIGEVLEHRERFDPVAMHERMTSLYAAAAVAERTVGLYEKLIAASGRGRRSGPGEGGQPAAVGRTWRPPLVVALVRELAVTRLGALPPELLSQLTVVTYPPAGNRSSPDPSPIGHWLVLDPERDYLERLAALGGPIPANRFEHARQALASPTKERLRKELIAHRADVRRESTTRILGDAWTSAGRPGHVVALDADDLIAIEPLVRAGASPGRAGGPSVAPGGLRWLVDWWDELGRPA